ncbi:hypothetical protein [Streptomyces sp. CNQ-509]|uniref:hypothetical protein n=1 Tax=Streptomyces sp. CNQ-509 TaxID=444103 RepID=UPI0013DD9D8F|nr:hypothetical protein [Streptomyces sp. CNQ-509]
MICRRWRIEETFQLTKGFTGLDQGQVTCWNSWMRWPLFSLIAAAVLTLTATAVHATAEDEAALVPVAAPSSSGFCEPSCCHHPSATANTSCTGPPGDANTKPPRPPATSNDTTATNHNQELQLPCQTAEQHPAIRHDLAGTRNTQVKGSIPSGCAAKSKMQR